MDSFCWQRAGQGKQHRSSSRVVRMHQAPSEALLLPIAKGVCAPQLLSYLLPHFQAGIRQLCPYDPL